MNDQANAHIVARLRATLASVVANRLASVKAQSMTASNAKKLTDAVDVATRSDAVAALLVACNYSAESMNQNVYSVEKVFDIVAARPSIYCNATFKSMIALESAEIEITRDVIASFCTNDVKCKYDAKIKATRVQSVKSKSTIATQHNSTINAFLALHMLNVSRNSNNDETFTLNRENDAVKLLAAKHEIAL